MRADRASDLHLVRETTERQQDQRVVEDQRADYLRRAEQEGSAAEPVAVAWDDVKL